MSLGRPQVVGDIFHALMREFNNHPPGTGFAQSDFRKAFNSVVEAARKRVQSLPASRHLGDPSQWGELTQIYGRLTDLVRRWQSSRSGTVVYAERRLESNDHQLVGTLDAYFVTPEGIALVDYKSGKLSDTREDAARLEYAEQLYFYAYLVQEAHGEHPSSLSLVGADGKMVEIPPNPVRSKELAGDMRAMLEHYNDLVARGVNLESVATPSPNSCTFCVRRPSCEKFWANVASLDIPPWNHVVVGFQRGSIERSRLGGGSIELVVKRSSLPTDILKITRIFEARYPHVDFERGDGQRLSITGLRQVRQGSSTLVEATDRTFIKCESAQ